jgi:hypothetical protein
MSKFCTSCGAEIAEDAIFCTTCGAQQGANSPQEPTTENTTPVNNPAEAPSPAPEAPTPEAPTPEATAATDAPQADAGNPAQPTPGTEQNATGNNFSQAAEDFAQNAKQTFNSVKDSMSIDDIKNVGKTKNKNTIIGLSAIAAVVVVIILIIVLCASLGGSGYKKPIDNFVKAISKTDGKAMKNALPDVVNEYYEDYYVDDDDYDSVEEYYEDAVLEYTLDYLEDEYGDRVKISYKVLKKKELKNSDLRDVEDDINDTYDADVEVTKGYKVKVKLTVKGSDDDDTDTEWLYVYKIDGNWCFASDSMF